MVHLVAACECQRACGLHLPGRHAAEMATAGRAARAVWASVVRGTTLSLAAVPAYTAVQYAFGGDATRSRIEFALAGLGQPALRLLGALRARGPSATSSAYSLHS